MRALCESLCNSNHQQKLTKIKATTTNLSYIKSVLTLEFSLDLQLSDNFFDEKTKNRSEKFDLIKRTNSLWLEE